MNTAMFLLGIGYFQSMSSLTSKGRHLTITGTHQESSECFPGSPQGVAGETKNQSMIGPLGVDETLEWCNSFLLYLKANGNVSFCLDLARLNTIANKIYTRVP